MTYFGWHVLAPFHPRQCASPSQFPPLPREPLLFYLFSGVSFGGRFTVPLVFLPALSTLHAEAMGVPCLENCLPTDLSTLWWRSHSEFTLRSNSESKCTGLGIPLSDIFLNFSTSCFTHFLLLFLKNNIFGHTMWHAEILFPWPYFGSTESEPLDCQGSPLPTF